MLEFERNLEAINRSMKDIQSDNNEYEKPSRFGYESCHNWKKEINVIQVKLDKALQPMIAYAIDSSKYERSLNHSYKKHKFVKKESNSKDTSHNNLYCLYCFKKGHTIEKYKFRKLLVPKGAFQWLPKCNLVFTQP